MRVICASCWLPESWIAPDHILDLRARVRLRHTLTEQHCEYRQRIQAVLYHHGCAHRRGLMVSDGRDWLAGQPLPATAREQVAVALAMIDALEVQIAPIDRELRAYARAQTGCKALIDAYWGIGGLTAVTIVSELGDCRRFSNSRDAVRYSGLDITVYQSDRHRAPGHLSRQGPPALRWALYEAAQVARHPRSPDRAYYEQAAEHLGGNRACLALARKLLKRCYHTLRELGDDALAPPPVVPTQAHAQRQHRHTSTGNRPRRRAFGEAASVRLHWPLDPAFGCAPWQLGQNPGTGNHQLRPSCARQVLTHTDAPRPAPESLLQTRHPREPPRKIERPQRFPLRDHPIKHLVIGPPQIRVADQSKPGRPCTPPPRKNFATSGVVNPGGHLTSHGRISKQR